MEKTDYVRFLMRTLLYKATLNFVAQYTNSPRATKTTPHLYDFMPLYDGCNQVIAYMCGCVRLCVRTFALQI